MHAYDAGVGGMAYGTYVLDTTLLTSCSGGVRYVTVAFNDPEELFGESTATIFYTVAANCPVSPSSSAPLPPRLASEFSLYTWGVFSSECARHADVPVLGRLSWQHATERLVGGLFLSAYESVALCIHACDTRQEAMSGH